MKNHNLACFCVILSVGCALLALPGFSPLEAGESEDYRFARMLRQDGMFIAAAEEYLRFAELHPHSVFRGDALFGAGESFMQAGRAAKALEAFEVYLGDFREGGNACKARFYRGRILNKLNRYTEASNEFLLLADEYPDCALAARAVLEAGECLLSAGNPDESAVVLRHLVSSRSDPEIIPRALYSLSLALEQTGRDIDAERILEKLVSEHPAAPASALAVLKLGDRALARGDHATAETRYRKVIEGFKEQSLQERAWIKILAAYEQRGDAGEFLEGADRFIDRFRDSKHLADVYRRSIRTAWELGRDKKALHLIRSGRSAAAVRDSTGEYLLLESRILRKQGKKAEALTNLDGFRRSYPDSPLREDELLLEAELLDENGLPYDAARVYHLSLLEGAAGDTRLSVLSRLAEISAEELGDTLAAIQYWTMVAGGGTDGGLAEKGLFNASVLRDRMGDVQGALKGYKRVMELFPGGTYAERSKDALELLRLRKRWGKQVVEGLARTVSGDDPLGRRCISAGVILLEEAGDPDGAMGLFDRALSTEIEGPERAEALFYSGRARIARHRRAAARGGSIRGERTKALNTWVKVIRDYSGSEWGGKAYRAYLDEKFADWKPAESVSKIDVFLATYGTGSGRWWALGRKVEFLYRLSQDGEAWAADSAITVSNEVLASGASTADKREVALKLGYLRRSIGDTEGAIEAFAGFVSRYGDDPRSAPLLYDLGETRLVMKNYASAHDAFARCLAYRPGRSLTAKCILGKGDCLYYMRRFGEAAGAYKAYIARFPDSDFADEALYRKALALEMSGQYDDVDKILNRLFVKRELPQRLRTRVLRKLGGRLLARGENGEALPVLKELIEMDRSSKNHELVAKAMFGTGDYKGAEKHYTHALRLQDADTSGVLAGRAKARFRLSDSVKGAQDLARLENYDPASHDIPGVYLEWGIAEVENGRCGGAGLALDSLRTRYPGTEESARALYYLALCDMKRRGYETAIDKLNTMLRESPHTEMAGHVYFKLASAHFGAGNLNLAAGNYALAAESLHERDLAFSARKNLALVYQELEEWERAGSAWKRMIDEYPGDEGIVEIFFNLGFCYTQAGNHQMAYEVYSRIPTVAVSGEQQGRAHYWSGIALKNLGRYDEAIRQFLRVPYLKTGGMWGVTAKLEAAACYQRLGALDEAETILRSIVASHGERSDWGKLAGKALESIRKARGEQEQNRDGSGSRGGSDDTSRGGAGSGGKVNRDGS